jgi:hypothetical protein
MEVNRTNCEPLQGSLVEREGPIQLTSKYQLVQISCFQYRLPILSIHTKLCILQFRRK